MAGFVKYIIIAGLVISAVLLPLKPLAALTFLVIVAAIVTDPVLLKKLRNKYLWVFLMLIAFVQPLLIGNKDMLIAGLGYSSGSLVTGLRISLRAVLMILVFSYLVRNSSALNLGTLWKKIGIPDFDRVFFESQRIMPHLKGVYQNTKLEFKEQNGKHAFTRPVEFTSSFLARALYESENEFRKGDNPDAK